MSRYLIVVGAVLGALVGLFLLVEAFDVPLLADPTPWLRQAGLGAAALGVGLLTVDVLIPVPANVVMVAHGALFGFWLGALLSVTGSVCAAALSFGIGRRGGPLVQRLVPAAARARADELLHRWGGLAIVVTRPIPILAEALMILAGSSPLSWRTALAMAFLGSLPAAALYALAGAAAVHVPFVLLVALVVPVVVVSWLLGRWFTRTPAPGK